MQQTADLPPSQTHPRRPKTPSHTTINERTLGNPTRVPPALRAPILAPLHLLVAEIGSESFEAGWSETFPGAESPKIRVAEPEAPRIRVAEREAPKIRVAEESELAELGELEEVGAEASRSISKLHSFMPGAKTMVYAQIAEDTLTLVDKKASTDKKVHAGIDLVSNGLMENGNPVAEATGVGMMVRSEAEAHLLVSDYSSKWGMDANQYLKSRGCSSYNALTGGAVATVLSTPVALGLSAYDKVKS